MRLVADTNILLRVLVRDDPDQTAKSERVLAAADRIVVPVLVACELAWVLRRSYRYSREDIHRALSGLMRVAAVEVDRPVLQAGLDHLSRGGDFADGCILEMSRAANCRLVTFDRKLLKLAGDLGVDAEALSDRQ